jgi:hypothetical protein
MPKCETNIPNRGNVSIAEKILFFNRSLSPVTNNTINKTTFLKPSSSFLAEELEKIYV